MLIRTKLKMGQNKIKAIQVYLRLRGRTNVQIIGSLSCRTATRRRRQKKICSNKLLYEKYVICYEWYELNIV